MWPFDIFRKKREAMEEEEKARAEALARVRADMERIERAAQREMREIDRNTRERIRLAGLAQHNQQAIRAAQVGGGKGGTAESLGRRQARAVDDSSDVFLNPAYLTNISSDDHSPRGGSCHGSSSSHGSSHSSSSCDSSSSDSGSSSSSSD